MPATSPTFARRTVTPAACARDGFDTPWPLDEVGGVTKVSAIARLHRLTVLDRQRGRDRLTKDANEALGMARLVAGHVERRRLRLVERERAPARDRAGRTLEQLDLHLARRGR